ncbi:hypothetical protein [Enterococcus xiangfangensis]|nr:hypothetical protein [Enterococcus xiangfangensis]MBM7712802.1 hypothetical protein [Enterococcus xiangfangensis]
MNLQDGLIDKIDTNSDNGSISVAKELKENSLSAFPSLKITTKFGAIKVK